MKILKYIGITIAALVLIFLALGMFNSSVSYGHEIVVNKPIEEAWAVSQDVSKYDQWLEGFKSMELISGEQFMPGSTYRVVVNPGEGQEDFVMTETLVSIKENDHVHLSFDSEMMDFEQTMTFTEVDGGTKIMSDSEVIGKGIMMQSMFACMELCMGAFDKQEAKNFDALKKLIEENTTVYGAPVEEISLTNPVDSLNTAPEVVAEGE